MKPDVELAAVVTARHERLVRLRAGRGSRMDVRLRRLRRRPCRMTRAVTAGRGRRHLGRGRHSPGRAGQPCPCGRPGCRAGPSHVRFLRDAEIEIVNVDPDAGDRAISAWRRYGKGRHRGGLNLGGCFVYALAERTGSPVLCTGADFAATDIHHPGRLAR